MTYTIVERNIGRAGTIAKSNEKKKAWDAKYGEGNWETGYELNGRFLTREEAIATVYFPAYAHALKTNKHILAIVLSYEGVMNPHAHFTNSVDLQAAAVLAYIEAENLAFKGTTKGLLPIGAWQPKKNKEHFFEKAQVLGINNNGEKLLFPRASYLLSPYSIMTLHDTSISVEEFWQSKAKCLAIK
jgi:hypothetical protein